MCKELCTLIQCLANFATKYKTWISIFLLAGSMGFQIYIWYQTASCDCSDQGCSDYFGEITCPSSGANCIWNYKKQECEHKSCKCKHWEMSKFTKEALDWAVKVPTVSTGAAFLLSIAQIIFDCCNEKRKAQAVEVPDNEDDQYF